MALPPNTRTGRPTLPGHGSFSGFGEFGRPSMGNEVTPSIAYVGYNITPRNSGYDRSRGKWYRAHTTEMPGTPRELEYLVRKQSLSGRTVLEDLYSSRMDGSKREHIESFIRVKDASNPGQKHDLAYLKLEQYYKHKEAKPSKIKTSSMQIILECRARPTNCIGPTQLPLTSHGSIAVNGNWPSSNAVSAKPVHGTTLTAPMKNSRPQYLPSYARQSEPSSCSNLSTIQSINGRSGRDSGIPIPTSTASDYDSDESEGPGPPLPCSTVSSDTVRPECGRRSSFSVSNGGVSDAPRIADDANRDGIPCATVGMAGGQIDVPMSPKNNREETPLLQPESSAIVDPMGGIKSQCTSAERPLLSAITRTNRGCAICGHTKVSLEDPDLPEQDVRSAKIMENGSFSDRDRPSVERNVSVEDLGSHDQPGDRINVQEGEPRQGSSGRDLSYEKPVWMNNLRPVHTPTIRDEDTDPLETATRNGPVPTLKAENVGEGNPKVPGPVPEGNIIESIGDDDSQAREQGKDKAQTMATSGAKHGQQYSHHSQTIPAHNNARQAENHFEQSSNPRTDEAYRPPAHLRLDTKPHPQKQSEAPSPKQRKRVTFSLPSPASTVTSTPVAGTPPSSPDTSSSSPSEFPTSKSSANTDTSALRPRRPPLHRQSHSSSSYTAKLRAHEPIPPRSASYKDLPSRGSHAQRGHDTDKPNRQSNRYDRHQPTITTNRSKIAAHPPVLVHQSQPVPANTPYECKATRCPSGGSSAFASREELEAHMRSVPDREPARRTSC